MSRVHFLNVRLGDCSIIEHASGRKSMIDICGGNIPKEITEERALRKVAEKIPGNFQMCSKPTNSVNYYLHNIGSEIIWRFILTHPDMDHLDGFKNLVDDVGFYNFWDSGVRRDDPDFREGTYNEYDWEKYIDIINSNNHGINILNKIEGARFQYANKGDPHDGLYILSPNDELVSNANHNGNINDASYVILYRSVGGRIIFSGDSHDATWEFILSKYEDDVRDCSILFAPHHGRKSDRSYKFLDTVKPKLSVFGCASSKDLAYNAWSSRGLSYITNNQCGNVVLECYRDQIEIYIQNGSFAGKAGGDIWKTNSQGYYYLDTIK